MDFFEVIDQRRSVRKYTDEQVPDEIIEKALGAAILAPNSSNVQSWDFYWVKTDDKKKKLVHACMDQSAARMAQHLIVVTADPKNWKRSQQALIQYVNEIQAPKLIRDYYEKLIPIVYRWGFLNSLAILKIVAGFVLGFFRPSMRSPMTRRDVQEVAIKSAALAAENFVLAITAQGYATCMMEGFDEWRVRSLLSLPWRTRIVMVISVGRESARGTWGPRFRLPKDQVVHII